MFADRKVVDNSAFINDNREAALNGYFFNALQNGDYYVYQMLYNKLKLNDNRRLLERLESTYNFSYRIEQNIYHDMPLLQAEDVPLKIDSLRCMTKSYYWSEDIQR